MTAPELAAPGRHLGARRNRLLASLSPDDYSALEPYFGYEEVELLRILIEANEPFTHVFFPLSGVISVVSRLADGKVVETGTVGNEGFANVDVILEGGSAPNTTMMQIPGEVIRVPAPALVSLAQERPGLRRRLLRYAEAYLIQVAQSAACNGAHEIAERCARWLLMTHDRMGATEQFLLTQEVLAEMLGVRRAGVTVAAGMLQKAGLIKYSRGRITVLDRAGLEAASCECYPIVKAHFDRLLDDSRS
ncbi:MAG: Crp/Fnr family transcriptional regulator [Gemmatimonadaceae bacterium]